MLNHIKLLKEIRIKLMEDLDININDVFDPEDPNVIQKITAVVEGERDDYVKYITLKENFKIFLLMKIVFYGIEIFQKIKEKNQYIIKN